MIWNIVGSLLLLLNHVQGHGKMIEPRSRNWRAHSSQEGAGLWVNDGNRPLVEYTPQGLNNAQGWVRSQCGVPQEGGNINYDRPLASNGQPLPWRSQATYTQGSTITIKLSLDAPHNNWNPGYFEFYACPRNQPLTEACFKQYPLTFVQDRLYGQPSAKVIKGNGSPQNYEYVMRLPSGLTGDVLIQWVWINTNSGTINTIDGPSVEKFRNCAEVTISGGGANQGTGTIGGTCGNGNRGNGVCANGQCCSQYGWCGTSSAHCSGGGTCGNGNRGNGVCANGQCCSQWGWCGTSSAHCSRERRLRGNETSFDN
jgi:predicted carbohydrate-binding protein with CBM5 and CBM33 domain